MQIFLVARNKNLFDAWVEEFDGVEDVKVIHGDIFSVHAEAIISPANSFGRMDGGIDYYYSEYFGWDLQDRLQAKIMEQYGGELPVGKALIVPTFHEKIKYLISCPTMRVPEDVSKTQNAYKAFKAGLLAAKAQNIQSLQCPGLGTLTGKIPPNECARQMRKAYDEVFSVDIIKKLKEELS